MATTVLTQHPIGAPFSGTIHNANLQTIENSFADLGPYVISGLTFSAGTGLSVSVVAGTASIGGRVTVSSTFIIAALVDATTNHIYLLNTGAGTSNTSGTAPANSAKLGTCVTAGGAVISVAMGRTSGRQQFRQPQALIPGGPSAGTASAGHPDAINLASWNATDAEGFALYGTLPSGAVPAPTLTAPVTFTLNDGNQNSVQTVLTLEHTYNAGGGATGIGTELDFSVETSTNGTNKIAANLQATLTDLTPATATGKLSFRTIANNAQVTPFTVATADIRIPQATAASAQHGLLNIGSGGFDGSGGHFSGDSPGTLLAMNAPNGYGGTYIDVQVNGVRLFYLDQFGTLFRLSAPVGTANDGQLSLGPNFAHFDGSSTGHFVGNANGQYLAINTESGFAGDLARFQVHGSNRYRQTATGDVTATRLDATTTTISDSLLLDHVSTGTAATGWGHAVHFTGQSTTTVGRDMGRVDVQWATATDATRKSRLTLSAYDTAIREGLRVEASGTAPQLSFYGTTAAVAQQTVTGSRSGGAALTDLLLKLATLGLVIDGSSA